MVTAGGGRVGWALGGAVALALALAAGVPERPSPLDLEVVPRGHQELLLGPDGSVRALWFGTDRPFEVCFDTPLWRDSSGWRGRVAVGSETSDAAFVEPSQVDGTVLCFAMAIAPSLPSSSALDLCVTVEDGFDGGRHRLPCLAVAYEADDSDYRVHVERAVEELTAPREGRHAQVAALFDRLADDAETAGYPALALGLRLSATRKLRQTGERGAEVAHRLAALPPWLAHPAAARWTVRAEHGRVELDLERGLLREALHRTRTTLHSARLAVVRDRIALEMEEAEILSQVGGGAPRRRLAEVLARCEQVACRSDLVPPAHGLSAWLTVLDPDATPAELERADADIKVALEGATSPEDRANELINRALLAHRQGRNADRDLAGARALLAGLEGSVRVHLLAGWADLVEGMAAIGRGDPASALAPCRRAAAAGDLPRLSAWAWSCLGRAHRGLADLERAEVAFEQALVRHELATARRVGEDLPLSPGERSDDYLRAARVAVERGRPAAAWRILERLDRLGGDLSVRCREAEGEAARRRLDARREELLERLAWTEPPLAPRRREQLEPVRQALRRSLEELERAVAEDCGPESAPAGKGGSVSGDPTVRAFPLPDELLVLSERRGEVKLVRRTQVSRHELRRTVGELEAAVAERSEDTEWRRRAASLAESLLPDRENELGTVTRFALYGVLQRVPLAALPLAAPDDDLWLLDATVPVLVSHGVERAPSAAAAPPLFVVDPRRDLPSGADGARLYRSLFPDARLLSGAAATRPALAEAMTSAAFLHVDAHGHYDDSFPQLSGLVMSDGVATLGDLTGGALGLAFANLSGCHTGAAAETGDSGRYGLAGALARRGVPWVIGSRATVGDSESLTFNRAFYRAVAAGATPAEAFGRALTSLRREHPASVWSRLFLVSS